MDDHCYVHPHHLDCEPYRDALSARLDGEEPGVDEATLDAHLAACTSCRELATVLDTQVRALRLRPARSVPDLAATIVARSAPRHRAPLAVLQWSLASLGTVLVLVGVAAALGSAAEVTHAHRELSAWYGAFGASLLVVSWQPDRARGLLPFAALVGLGLVATAVVDVATGRSPALQEASHLLELAGVALVAATARIAPPLPSSRRVLA